MVFCFLKTLVLFLYGYYVLEKVVIRKPSNFRQILSAGAFFVLLSLISALADLIPQTATVPVLSSFDSLHQLFCVPITVFGMLFVLITVFRIPLRIAYQADIIAFGIVYGAYLLMIAVCSILCYAFKINGPSNENPLFYHIIIIPIVLTAPCLFLLLHVKRFRSGMPFLRDDEALGAGTWIGLFLLVTINWAFVATSKNTLIVLLLSVSFICPLILILWWRKRLQKRYLTILQKQELDFLRTLTENQKSELQTLTTENDALSAVIHRDNKIIPAMEYAVRTFLSDPNADHGTGVQLLEHLSQMTAERKGILHTYESQEQTIQLTDDPAIDSVLNYMFQKAKAQNVRFDTSVSDFRSTLSRQAIEIEDVKTILADLIENALIACNASTFKHILVHIGTVNKRFIVRVFDSGAPFNVQILNKLGQERITTHADSGGSGIGMKTLFEIKRKYQASIILCETGHGSGTFSKNISMVFNQQGQFIVKSDRADELRENCSRKDIVILDEVVTYR